MKCFNYNEGIEKGRDEIKESERKRKARKLDRSGK